MLQTSLIVPPERRATVPLPDGRRLALAEWGHVDATPVHFCTGASMSGSLGFGCGDLPALGLRLVAIDRPGLGGSDSHAGKTLTTWVHDVRALAAARSLDAPLCVGFSQGAPFALALAAAVVVRAVALVSGQDELGHPALAPRPSPLACTRRWPAWSPRSAMTPRPSNERWPPWPPPRGRGGS